MFVSFVYVVSYVQLLGCLLLDRVLYLLVSSLAVFLVSSTLLWRSARAAEERRGSAEPLARFLVRVGVLLRMILRGWRNTVGNLIEIGWLEKACHGPQFTGTCVKHRGVRFRRIRDFKQYCFNSIPPTSQIWMSPYFAYRPVCISSARCVCLCTSGAFRARYCTAL